MKVLLGSYVRAIFARLQQRRLLMVSLTSWSRRCNKPSSSTPRFQAKAQRRWWRWALLPLLGGVASEPGPCRVRGSLRPRWQCCYGAHQRCFTASPCKHLLPLWLVLWCRLPCSVPHPLLVNSIVVCLSLWGIMYYIVDASWMTHFLGSACSCCPLAIPRALARRCIDHFSLVFFPECPALVVMRPFVLCLMSLGHSWLEVGQRWVWFVVCWRAKQTLFSSYPHLVWCPPLFSMLLYSPTYQWKKYAISVYARKK